MTMPMDHYFFVWRYELAIEISGRNLAGKKFIDRAYQDAIREHIISLNQYCTERLLQVPGLSITGPIDASLRCLILSFRVDAQDSRDFANRLNEEFKVMVRAGKNCVHYWFSTHGGDDVVRASFGPYSSLEECEVFCNAVEALTQKR